MVWLSPPADSATVRTLARSRAGGRRAEWVPCPPLFAAVVGGRRVLLRHRPPSPSLPPHQASPNRSRVFLGRVCRSRHRHVRAAAGAERGRGGAACNCVRAGHAAAACGGGRLGCVRGVDATHVLRREGGAELEAPGELLLFDEKESAVTRRRKRSLSPAFLLRPSSHPSITPLPLCWPSSPPLSSARLSARASKGAGECGWTPAAWCATRPTRFAQQQSTPAPLCRAPRHPISAARASGTCQSHRREAGRGRGGQARLQARREWGFPHPLALGVFVHASRHACPPCCAACRLPLSTWRSRRRGDGRRTRAPRSAWVFC